MNRLRGFGTILRVIGILIPLVYGLYFFFASGEIPLIIRISLGLLFGGILIVLVSLIRERIEDLKKGR